MKQGKTLQELAREIARQNEAKQDFLVDTRQLIMKVHDDQPPTLEFTDRVFNTNDIIHDQIGTKLGIPARYYDKMRSEQPQLLTENVNTWFRAEPERRMIRTLDGTARAYLSERYRRIDHHDIVQSVLPLIVDMAGAEVKSCEITERRMYIKVVNPRIQAEVSKGDIVQSGLVISNSETGFGAVSVMPLIFRLVCSNGMIAADHGTRKYHVGRANESDDNYEVYRSETIKADDHAFRLKLQDTVRAAIDTTRFRSIVGKMRDGTEAKISSQDIPAVIELAGKHFGLTEDEGKSVLDHLIRDGNLNLFGLSSAITRTAQDVKSYDRSTELEATGWSLLNVDNRTWQKWNAA